MYETFKFPWSINYLHTYFSFQNTAEITNNTYIEPIFPEDIPSSNDTIDPSIVMGDRVQPGEIPWQAFLLETRTNGETYICGGSLIRPTWVFTAAHCIVNPGTIVVHLGGTHIHNMPYRQTARAKIVHENYNSNTIQNDVGLLLLPVAASGSGIRTIPLAPDSVGSLAGTLMRLSGFGRTSSTGQSSPDLLKVTLRGISNTECLKTFGNIVSSSLCANYSTKPGQSGCQGDSGGPLTVRLQNGQDVLVGVVSFGGPRCDQGMPSAFARVTSFRSWAINNMDRSS